MALATYELFLGEVGGCSFLQKTYTLGSYFLYEENNNMTYETLKLIGSNRLFLEFLFRGERQLLFIVVIESVYGLYIYPRS
jgi:hypothetical protein